MKKSNRNTLTSSHQNQLAAERILAYFDMRNELFLTALSDAQSYYAVEGIHELRVEVKKLRALYKLVEQIAPSFAAKPNASSLRELFRAAGELRDLDIHQALTMKWIKKLDLREYFNYLKHKELQSRESFMGVSKSFSKAVITNSRAQTHSALSVTTSERVRKRMDKRIKKLINKLMTPVGRKKQCVDDLHSVRKTSKALRYTIDIWQQCFGKTPTNETALVHLKKTYSCLGEWHDTLLTFESVETFLKHKDGKNLVDPSAYKNFRTDLLTRAESLLSAYNRGKKPLERALESISADLHKESIKQMETKH